MIKFTGRYMIFRRIASRVIPVICCLVLFTAQCQSQVLDSTQVVDSISTSLKPGKDGVKSPVMVDAVDSIITSNKDKKMYMYKKAVVTYEDMKLEADFIEVDFNTNEIHAKGLPDSTGEIVGKPIFTTDGKPFNAEEMSYIFKT